MGYKINRLDDWDDKIGVVCAIINDPVTGKLIGRSRSQRRIMGAGKIGL